MYWNSVLYNKVDALLYYEAVKMTWKTSYCAVQMTIIFLSLTLDCDSISVKVEKIYLYTN